MSPARAGPGLPRTIASHAILLLVGVTMLVPFVWTLSTSLKAPGAVFEKPPRWIPWASRTYAPLGDDGAPVEVKVLREAPDGGVRVKVAEPGPRRGEVARVEPGRLTREEGPDLHPENYPRAWRAYPFVSFWRAYANSLAVALIVTVGHVLTSSLAAFAFARLRFPGRDVLFFLYLATMMVPGAVTMTPTFSLIRAFPDLLSRLFGTDWFTRELVIGGSVVGVDSYFALIVPRLFSAYGTFMLRQFFMSVPRELEEAARLDGCSTFGVYWRVVLPLCRPALATLAIFTFMWTWGDFLWPLIVTNSNELKTLPLLLASFQGQHTTAWHLLMAASLTALVPMLVVFLLGQRYFIEGIKLGAVKG